MFYTFLHPSKWKRYGYNELERFMVRIWFLLGHLHLTWAFVWLFLYWCIYCMTWSSDFIAIAPTLHNTCSIVQCMHPEILNSSQLLNYILKPCIKTSQCALKAFVTQCKNVIRFTKKRHVEDLISSLPPFTPKKSIKI